MATPNNFKITQSIGTTDNFAGAEVDFFYMTEEEKGKARERQKKKTGIERKKELYQEVVKLLDNDDDNIPAVKKVQKEWKMIGKLPIEEDKEINLNFRIVCNEIFEVHFLNSTVSQEFPEFSEMVLTEQIKLKIRVLKESIKVDEYEATPGFSSHAGKIVL